MVSNTPAMRKAWREYRCIREHEDRRRISILGVFAGVCPPEMVEPFEALSQALDMAGYRDAKRMEVPRPCTRGIDQSIPCGSDGANCSLHNYGIAVDVDPQANPKFPDGVPGTGWRFSDDPVGGGTPIKLTKAQVDAVRAIRTIEGKQLFRWLGDAQINDTMHFEVQVPPDATAVDWDTVAGERPMSTLLAPGKEGDEDDMWLYLTVGENLVQHAWNQGWLEPKTQATLDFFVAAVRSGDINESTWPDFRNFRVAVTNGIALGAGSTDSGDQ